MLQQHSAFISPAVFAAASQEQTYWPQAGREPVCTPSFDAADLDVGYEGAFPFLHQTADGSPS